MTFPFSQKPPFAVPTGLTPVQKNVLSQTKLFKFYEKNNRDFFALITVVYFCVMSDPNPGFYTDVNKGFESFCDLLTESFLAAGSETIVAAKDEKGRAVNFFGEAILAHGFPSKVTSQSLYAHDGSTRFSEEWKWISLFVRYVAIDFFLDASSFPMLNGHIESASQRMMQLMERERTLIFVSRSPFK